MSFQLLGNRAINSFFVLLNYWMNALSSLLGTPVFTRNGGALSRFICDVKKEGILLNGNIMMSVTNTKSNIKAVVISFTPVWGHEVWLSDNAIVVWMITDRMDMISTVMKNKSMR